MDKKKQRQRMKAFYFAKKSIDMNCKILNSGMHGLAQGAVMSVANANLENQLYATPWQFFRHDRPEIDKRRAKRWHEKNKPGRDAVIVGINWA